MSEIPPLDEFSHGTVTLADDPPHQVDREWAHYLVELHDEPAHDTRYARFCAKVATSNRAQAAFPRARAS
ncbi:hypothetical protein [Frankia sp. EAN1pec]|uniref:hypothetical protein n=1 Tax=Parafrankia sp. (strain EAN1pec) TaxID=298653 RepID=UPI00059D27D6